MIPLTDLTADFAALAADERIAGETATNLIARALRAVRPRTERPSDRHAALDALLQALAEGPRGRGRPPVGSERTVRAPDEVWAQVDAYARERGVSAPRAAADLIRAGLAAGAP